MIKVESIMLDSLEIPISFILFTNIENAIKKSIEENKTLVLLFNGNYYTYEGYGNKYVFSKTFNIDIKDKNYLCINL